MARVAAQNLKDVREALRWARDEDKSLEPYGGGTKRSLGRPLHNSYALGLGCLSGILSYEPDELVISMRATTPLAEVEALLSKHRQHLAFEPPDWSQLFSAHEKGESSMSGIISSNLSGARRFAAGAARDHLLGFRALSGRGVEFQSGGRVVKNVTGYDLSKLIAGSWGTLAIMSELTLKTMPAPETTRTLFLYGADSDKALNWMEIILSKNPAISGAVHIPLAATKQWGGLEASGTSLTAFRLEGTNQATQELLNGLQGLVGADTQMNNNEGDAALQFWRSVNNLTVFSAPSANINAPLWRILTPRDKAANLVAQLEATCEDVLYFIDWGGGLIWFSHDTSSGEPELNDFSQQATHIRNICLEHDAKAILIRASLIARQNIPFMPPLSDALLALTARIKNAFDPNNILNPGRLYHGI